MGMPAARILLKTTENIEDSVAAPSIAFKRKGNKSIVTITLAFKDIANAIEDSDLDDDPLVFCDALYSKVNFLRSGNARVSFTPLGVNGASTMNLSADIDTKLPGTGGDLHERLERKATGEKPVKRKGANGTAAGKAAKSM